MPEIDLSILHKRDLPNLPPRSLAIRQFLRRNLLIILSAIIFVSVAVMVFSQMDRVYYGQAKEQLVADEIRLNRLLGDGSRDQLSELTKSFLLTYTAQPHPNPRIEEQRLELLHRIEDQMVVLLENNPMAYRVVVKDRNGEVVAETSDYDRIEKQNNWSNSLFTRQWLKRLVSDSRSGNQNVGTTELYYTSPLGVPEIESLTREWRFRIAAVGVGLACFYAALLWGLLLPVRRVIKALDKGAEVGAPVIPRPRTLLERYYNNLARDATLSLFSTGLREFVSREGLLDHQPLLRLAPPLIDRLFHLDCVEIWTYRHSPDEDRWVSEGYYSVADDAKPDSGFQMMLAHALASEPPDEHPDAWSACVREFFDDNDAAQSWFVEHLETSDSTVTLFVAHASGGRRIIAGWWQELYQNIAQEIRFAMRTISEQRRMILQEKSKANISLSRNLGHDLTNIIATSKLELMTVKRFLEMPPQEIRDAPVKQQIFGESLQALLNNTRFLQEIVNLYRSFTYLSRPKFEKVSLSELVHDVSELFSLSISPSIDLHLELDENLQPLEVEPRLLRLALFNILSNAADSIKRSTAAEKPRGEIWLRTRRGERQQTQEVLVEDNGDGIRGHDGHLLKPEEIDEIFRLGFTTKEKNSGEGLGLNWVQQIVRDFHQGQIMPRNRSAGGASFSIILPLEPAEGAESNGSRESNETNAQSGG
ncbi:hypothetical protein KQI84_01760 [bacterium]|nr:hypothetical protein [bacterium]